MTCFIAMSFLNYLSNNPIISGIPMTLSSMEVDSFVSLVSTESNPMIWIRVPIGKIFKTEDIRQKQI